MITAGSTFTEYIDPVRYHEFEFWKDGNGTYKERHPIEGPV